MSELKIMLEKEKEMRDLYNEILKDLENLHLKKKIESIRDEEIKHVSYVEILISLFEEGPAEEGAG